MPTTRLLVNCPNAAVATELAEALLEARLVACANIYPEITSHYVWQGARQVETEVPLLLKTRPSLVPEVEAMVVRLHPYDVPPLVEMPLGFVHAAYDAWVEEMTSR
ncbi:MAG: divalent-cation tolerance protein CutA [Pseudomonadota bacterium]